MADVVIVGGRGHGNTSLFSTLLAHRKKLQLKVCRMRKQNTSCPAFEESCLPAGQVNTRGKPLEFFFGDVSIVGGVLVDVLFAVKGLDRRRGGTAVEGKFVSFCSRGRKPGILLSFRTAWNTCRVTYFRSGVSDARFIWV